MAADKRLLIETLLAIGQGEKVDLLEGEDDTELARACLLHVTSNSPESCAAVDRLEYETYDDESTGTPYWIRGLTLSGPGMTLRDFVEVLDVELEDVPAPFKAAAPDLTLEDYRAGLYALRAIVYALEQSEHDGKQADRYAPEKAKSALAATLRSLRSFRETGEP